GASEQLERLLALPRTVGIEVDAGRLLADRATRDHVVQEAQRQTDAAAADGLTPVLYTSRAVERPSRMEPLQAGQAISSGLVDIVAGLRLQPAFVVAKGGITSSDIGTRAFGVRRAEVLGQIQPGVPVWKLGAEARFPGMPYIVFPGNVGGVETLATVVAQLRQDDAHSRS
ncbi:MAG TPA: nucleotide-binding domain containing protein, partial [Thermomicrobiales bacterium]|nr:nucleotide-binding domain containing protein [Thermomicrobiales bacterium]